MKLLSPPIVILVLFTIGAGLSTYYLNRRGLTKREYHRDVLAVATIALLAILFFWQPIWSQGVWIPAGGGDMASMLYPNYHFIGESLWAHELPLWNPYLFGGEPFAADIQTGIFYPVNLLFWAVAHPVTYGALQWLVYFHFFLAGFFTYVLLCGLTTGTQKPISRLAALAGAVAYMFSDIFVTHIGNLNLIAVAAWLPLVFLLFHRAVVERRFSFAIGAGIAMGMAFLAGHIQPFLYIAVALGLYFLFHAYLLGRNRATRSHLPKLCAIVALFAIVTFGLMAIQFLPSQELADLSVRSEITYATSTEYSLSPAELISLVIPNFFGRGPSDYWGQWLRSETGYIGVFTLIAAALAVLLRRQRYTYFLAGLAVIGLLLALGGYTVLQGWVFTLVPGFEKVRAPARFILLFDFAIAILAGLGIDVLLKPLRRWERPILDRARSILAIATIVLVAVVLPIITFILATNREQSEGVLKHLTGTTESLAMFAVLLALSLGLIVARQKAWARRATIGLLAIALIAFDLISAGHDLELTTTDPTSGYQQQTVVDFLKTDGSFYRVDSDTNVWDIWQPNAAPFHGIMEVQGAGHPLELASFRNYWSSLGSRSTQLYDLLNVKYIIGRKGVPLDFTKWKLAFDADPVYSVYENINVLPRAFVVHNSVVQPDIESHITTMKQQGFDLSQSVVLDKGKALNLGADIARQSTAAISNYRNNSFYVDVDAAADGYLVLSEMYHSGWKATVDGQETPVLRADYTFRAVAVGAGKHSVYLYFSPASWELGRNISIVTWIAVLAWAALWAWRNIRRRPAAPIAKMA